MLNYLLRRLSLLFSTGLILTIIAFTVTSISVETYAPDNSYVVEYFHYINSIFQGDWGHSALDQKSILIKGWYAFASTLELCFLAFLGATIIALPLGILAALNRNRFMDYLVMSLVLIGLALPVFWLSVVVTMSPKLFSISLPINPDMKSVIDTTQLSGFLLIDLLFTNPTCESGVLCNRFMQLLLSSAVLAIFLISEITRLTRHSVTATMKSNFVKASYAKGLSSRQIIIHHVFKNSLPPIIHQIRLQLSTIISFAMVIEIVFSMPGTGSWLLTSIKAGDYLALPTALLLISGFILFTSVLVDILLVVISPIKRKSLYVD